MVAAAPASGHPRWLESGAGTGKASLLLAGHLDRLGAELTCLEPDPAMAAVLSRNLEQCRRVTVVVEGFEDFATRELAEGGRGSYALLAAAQSWHWLAPDRRAALAANMLEPGGVLALIWNVSHPHDTALQAALDEVYAPYIARYDWWRSHKPSPGAPQRRQPSYGSDANQYVTELERSGLFADVRLLRRPWSRRYLLPEWLALLRTQSEHRLLPPSELDELLEQVHDVVERFGGAVTVEYSAVAVMAHPRP